MVPSYRRDIERAELNRKREEARKAQADASEYYGEVGQRVELSFNKAELVTSYSTAYGTSYIYKFIDAEGRVFIWSTGIAVIDDPDSILRCSNKVYLQELMTVGKIPAPKTIIAHSENRHTLAKELGFPESKMYDLDWMIKGMYRGEDTADEIMECVRNYVQKHVIAS